MARGARVKMLMEAAAILAAMTTAAAASAAMTAGAGRANIDIPASALPLDGFGTVHDPLQARVLVLDDKAHRVAIAVVDQTSIAGDNVAQMAATVGRIARLKPAEVLVIASHTFSAPHFFAAAHLPPGMTTTAEEQARGAAYETALMDAVSRAARDAARTMRPAHLAFGSGSSDVNVNRNVSTPDGWWLGADDSGASDKMLQVVRFDGDDRRPIALLVNYAVQSAVMNHSLGKDGQKGVTADLGGATVQHVERVHAGAVALFLTGAAGDQVPRYASLRPIYDKDRHFEMADLGEQGYSLVQVQGEHLGTDAVRIAGTARAGTDIAGLSVITGAVTLDEQQRPRNLQQLHPSRTYTFAIGGKVQAPYWIMQIGDIALVGVQAELSAATGEAIRRQSPYPRTLVVTMVNGAAKYMPDADAYQKITYEAMNSPFARGSAEIFTTGIVQALGAMRRNPATYPR